MKTVEEMLKELEVATQEMIIVPNSWLPMSDTLNSTSTSLVMSKLYWMKNTILGKFPFSLNSVKNTVT